MSAEQNRVRGLLQDELRTAEQEGPTSYKIIERIAQLSAALRDLTQVYAIEGVSPSPEETLAATQDPVAVIQDHTDLLILRDVLAMVTPGMTPPEIYRRVQAMYERAQSALTE